MRRGAAYAAASGRRLADGDRADLADTVESFAAFLSTQRIRLSRAALETLSVIAYNQPITMSEIEEIAPCAATAVVETLLKTAS